MWPSRKDCSSRSGRARAARGAAALPPERHHRMRGAVVGCVFVAALGLGCSRAQRDDAAGKTYLDDGRTFASDADADTYTGPAPLIVHFTTQTINASGKPSYRWTFDDHHAESTEQNPLHTFSRPGWYAVTMDTRDASGATYRANLLLHAWRPRDWARLQQHRDMRIVMRSLRELKRKNAETEAAATALAASQTPAH